MTVAELMGALKPGQAWAVVFTIAGLMVAVATVAYRAGAICH